MTCNHLRTLVRPAALVALVAAPVAAQSSATVTINMPVNVVVVMTISSGTTALTAPVVTDYNGAGIALKNDNGPTVSAIGNKAWQVTLKSTTAFFTKADGVTLTSKPIGDLAWGTTAGSFPNLMATSNSAAFLTGSSTTASKSIFYQTKWNVTNAAPGTYQAIVQFTVSAP